MKICHKPSTKFSFSIATFLLRARLKMSKTTQLSSQITFQILLSILLFTLPFNATSQTPTSSPEEQIILLKLKQQWLNPPSLSHWNSSSDHCSWPGITCTNGSVTKINASNLAITETIPPIICDLKNLAILDLNTNNIPGLFPTVLYNCSKLEYLDLSLNYFIGTIPDDIDRLSPGRLQYLSLEANNFTGDIPPAIGKLTGLKSLYARENLFNGSFPAEIGNLLNLEELALSTNDFAPQALPSSFTRLNKLRYLWMFQTNLIGEIPQDIGNMTALEQLDLSENNLSGNIPGSLFQLKNLSLAYLYKNRLSGSIPTSVEALNLDSLDLSSNSLTGKIPEEFGKLTKLTGLALMFNELSGEVPASIGMLPSLRSIKLFSNNLSGQLPPDFGRHSMLTIFEVATNNFVGNLPEDLCKNGVLRGLVTVGNNLIGELPQSLGKCSSLEVVRLEGNRFSGLIPGGLWTATNLTTLTISNNSFTGQLPDKVASGLSTLEISYNRFSGEIPAGVSSWNNLRAFKASNNLLSGKIPQELTSLPVLGTLLLDGNLFSGSLPSSIISWKGLNILNFSKNHLSGQIPAAIGFLPVLNALDLSENEFSGEIPAPIGLLKLSSLNLSSNRLSGRVPGEFENAVFDRSFLDNPGLCSGSPSLGLNSCAHKTGKSNTLSPKFVAAVSSISAVGFLLALLYTFFLIRGYNMKKQRLDSTKLTSFHKLDFTASSILSSLTESNMIGSGGSGKVYRVPVNHSGTYVAVKKICNSRRLDEKLEKEFIAEVEILGTIRHSNIVKLMCCISTESSKLLVYEYLENCSLDRWLHCKRRSSTNTGSIHHNFLEWPRRLQIAIAAARGLCYMHHDCSPPIIHRDVKSSNILLDSEFNAKIADFGLARMLVKDGEPNTMSVVAGSFGYIAPEYAQTRRVDEKIDVYSFGVILLELVTGREGNDGDETSSLAEWAWRHFQEGKPIVDALDVDIKEPCYLDEIIKVFKVGIFCTSLVPANRPTMKEVLQILLRSVHSLPLGEKNGRSEYDVAPLLNNSKRERSLIDEDESFDSII